MEETWLGLYITKKNYNTFSDQRIYFYELSVARLQPSTGKQTVKQDEMTGLIYKGLKHDKNRSNRVWV